jgi:hypothetical protein
LRLCFFEQVYINEQLFNILKLPLLDRSDFFSKIKAYLIQRGILLEATWPSFFEATESILWRTYRNKRSNCAKNIYKALLFKPLHELLGVTISPPPTGGQALAQWESEMEKAKDMLLDPRCSGAWAAYEDVTRSAKTPLTARQKSSPKFENVVSVADEAFTRTVISRYRFEVISKS